MARVQEVHPLPLVEMTATLVVGIDLFLIRNKHWNELI